MPFFLFFLNKGKTRERGWSVCEWGVHIFSRKSNTNGHCGIYVMFTLPFLGPPRMSPKAQRHPRNHRVSAGRGSISSGLEFVSHTPPSEAAAPPTARTSPAGGTWSSVVSGGRYTWLRHDDCLFCNSTSYKNGWAQVLFEV